MKANFCKLIVRTAFFFWTLTPALCTIADTRPNFLLLLADDLAFDAVAFLGNAEIETPNLDRLARRGTTFTHAYNQGGWHGAVCVASRTMLVTGRFLWHAHADEPRLASHYVAQRLLWPQLLEDDGYDTYFTGKWHVKANVRRAFQTIQRLRQSGMPKDSEAAYGRPLENVPDPWSPTDKSFGGYWEGDTHWSEVLADDAIHMLEAASERERPFFMYVAFNAPHDPRQSPPEFLEKYPLAHVTLPQPFLTEYPLDIDVRDIRDERLAPYPRSEHAVKVHRREYYGIISHLDAQVGRILDRLEQSDLAENTYVIFTSDHGLACGHHGLMGKQNLYDHSVRVPLVIAGPNIEQGKRIATPVYLQDVMPTTLELADVEPPSHVEFRSLTPLLRGESDEHYDAIYGAFMDTQRMTTDGRKKLIVYPKLDVQLLFDLESDPLETHNLAQDAAHAATVSELRGKLRKLQAEVGDSFQ